LKVTKIGYCSSFLKPSWRFYNGTLNMATGKILVTGGLGFIGSHTITSLADKNEDIVIIL
jgi:hypothetical protein